MVKDFALVTAAEYGDGAGLHPLRGTR